MNGPVEDKKYSIKPFKVEGTVAKHNIEKTGDIDFEQPRAFWTNVFSEFSKQHLVDNMVNHMKTCRTDIKERMIALTTRVHPDFGQRIAKGFNITYEPKL